jgi:hypothetical protein
VKSDEARGRFATWLRAQRRAPRPGLPNGWKEAETVRRLEAAVPGVSFGAYRDIEAGNRPPTVEQRKAIEAVFGAIPDFDHSAGSGGVTAADPAALIEALAAQTKAIGELVEELRLSRLAQPLSIDDQIEAAERALAELKSRIPQPQPAGPARSAGGTQSSSAQMEGAGAGRLGASPA